MNNKIFRCLILCVSAVLILALMSCSNDDEEKVVTAKDKLVKTWGLGEFGTYVKKEKTEITEDVADLKITFNADQTFTTSNANGILDEAGAWSANDITYSSITVNNKAVQILELNENKLVISFEVGDEDGGRLNGVAGSYEISLTPQ